MHQRSSSARDRLVLSTALSVVLLFQAAPALAQAVPEAPADEAAAAAYDNQDITVTARRREEQLQDVPIAITAISGDALNARGVFDVQQLNFATPSLQVAASAFGSSVPGYAIRGQRLIEQILPLDPSVGVYFGDVVQQRPHGTNQILYDLESVQVLKGPQGTLFGRNTTGGAVLITPRKPVLGALEGRVSGTIGNYGLYGGEMVLNAPIGETFAVRAAGKVRYHKGYGRNLVDGSELNDENMESFRVSALWEPAAGVSSHTIFSYFNQKDNGFLYSIVGINPASFVPALFPGALDALERQRGRSAFQVELDGETFDRTRTWSVSNTTAFDISDTLTLKNIIGYRKVDNSVALDFDGTPFPIFHTRNRLDADQFTEELQLLGDAIDNRLNYILGAYYFREAGEDIQASTFYGGRPASREGKAINTSFSLFAQTDFKFTDQFTLTTGLRQTWDKRYLRNFSRASPPVGDPRPDLSLCRLEVDDTSGTVLPIDQCERITRAKFDRLTYLVTLSFQPTSDMLLYATHNTGYRSGGINLRAVKPSESIPFRPENAKNYEGGVKLDLFDRRLRVNAAGYYTDYKNIQRTLQQLCPAPGATVTCVTIENAASASIKGLELEVTARPVPWLTLGGFYGYTKAKYKRFIVPSTGADLSNNIFAFVPKTSYGFNGSIDLPLGGDGTFSAALNYYHQSSMQGADLNDTVPVPAYGIWNGSISFLRVGGGNIDAVLFMNNITDKEYAPSSIDNYASVGTDGYAWGAPRNYGITLTYHF